jgi:predicted transcriptional regulator of viral defense system
MDMKYYEDFLKLEVFNLEDARKVVGSKENAKVLLNSYIKKGLVKRVRRDLYCVTNLENREAPADRYLIGSKINKGAYLTYHSAFEVHGLSHQVSFVVYVASDSKISDFEFEGVLYKYVGKGINEGVIRYRLNEKIRLTDLERTVVDSIDRPDYCGGFHELDEILKICPVLDETKLVKYLEAYDKKVLYKKVGYFLERHQESLEITNSFLSLIEKRTGNKKNYLGVPQKFDRTRSLSMSGRSLGFKMGPKGCSEK